MINNSSSHLLILKFRFNGSERKVILEWQILATGCQSLLRYVEGRELSSLHLLRENYFQSLSNLGNRASSHIKEFFFWSVNRIFKKIVDLKELFFRHVLIWIGLSWSLILRQVFNGSNFTISLSFKFITRFTSHFMWVGSL